MEKLSWFPQLPEKATAWLVLVGGTMAQQEAWTEEGGLDLWEGLLFVSMEGVWVRMSLLRRKITTNVIYTEPE